MADGQAQRCDRRGPGDSVERDGGDEQLPRCGICLFIGKYYSSALLKFLHVSMLAVLAYMAEQ
jgi:hypothetical protein